MRFNELPGVVLQPIRCGSVNHCEKMLPIVVHTVAYQPITMTATTLMLWPSKGVVLCISRHNNTRQPRGVGIYAGLTPLPLVERLQLDENVSRLRVTWVEKCDLPAVRVRFAVDWCRGI